MSSIGKGYDLVATSRIHRQGREGNIQGPQASQRFLQIFRAHIQFTA